MRLNVRLKVSLAVPLNRASEKSHVGGLTQGAAQGRDDLC